MKTEVAHMTPMRVGLSVLATGLGLLLIAPFAVDRWVVPMVASSFEARQTDLKKKQYVHLESYRRDLEILRPLVAFLDRPRTKDAGPYLNPRSKWSFGTVALSKVHAEARVENLDVGEAAEAALKAVNGDLYKLDPARFAGVDTEWLTRLGDFDYWDVDRNGPIDAVPRVSLTSPTPELDLQAAKFHLAKAYAQSDADFATAVREVLHYGELVFTTESLVGNMVFVATVGLAREAAERRPAVRAELGPWAALLDQKDRLKRVYWSVTQFTRPLFGADPKIMADEFRAQSFARGGCAAIREATGVDWPLWSAVSDGLPELFADYRKLVETHPTGCRLTWIKHKTPAWVRLPSEPESFFSSGQAFTMYGMGEGGESGMDRLLNASGRLIHYMPRTRRLVGLFLMTVAVPSFTGPYDKLATAKAAGG